MAFLAPLGSIALRVGTSVGSAAVHGALNAASNMIEHHEEEIKKKNNNSGNTGNSGNTNGNPPKPLHFGAFDFFSPLNYNNMFHYDFGAPKKRKVGRPKKGRGRPKGKGKKTTKRTTTKKKGTSTKKSIYELVFTSKIHGIAKPVGIYKKDWFPSEV